VSETLCPNSAIAMGDEEDVVRRSHSRLAGMALLISVVAAVSVAPTAVFAASPAAFDVIIGDQCVDGFSAEIAPQHFIWKSGGGATKADTTVTPVDSGNWQYCSGSPSVVVAVGDVLSITYQSTVHELTIPELTLNQNRTRDVYKGRGPAGDYVKLICGISNGFEPCDQTWRLRVNSEGRWSYKPHWNVQGGDYMFLMWRSGGDHVQVISIAPYLQVTIGSAVVTGATRALTNATVVDHDGSSFDVRGSLVAQGSPFDGTFSGKLRNGSGKAAKVRVGDVIASDIAADAEFEVTDIELDANAATDRIKGDCGHESEYRVSVFHDGSNVGGDHWYTEGDGTFKITDVDFEPGDRVNVACRTSTDDWIAKWFTAM
jgi:hypothetical protein